MENTPKSKSIDFFSKISIIVKYYTACVLHRIMKPFITYTFDNEVCYIKRKLLYTPHSHTFLEHFFIFLFFLMDKISYKFKSSRWSIRNLQLNNFKYEMSYTNINSSNFVNFFLNGFRYVWMGVRYWVVGLLLALLSFYYLSYVRLLPMTRLLFEYLLLAMFVYWLLSGFVFFIKKYQYSKFTSVIQRFWKRTYALFWALETFVFLIFFYLTLNASEEPVYMYDQMKLYKTHLFSWRWFLKKSVPYVFLILISSYVMANLRWGIYMRQSTVIFVMTLVLLYILWLEFYQFFHIVNWYSDFNWVFDYDDYLWSVEIENRRTRLCNNYAALCLMAKFWHLIFIFIFWVFFVLRVNEIGRIRYTLFAACHQNFIILYIMSWLYMYPWLKYLGRKYLDVSFYWLFVNFRDLGVRVFFNDMYLYFIGVTEFIFGRSNLDKFYTGVYYYWVGSSNYTGYASFIKNTIMVDSFSL
jgi:hypothetical protein